MYAPYVYHCLTGERVLKISDDDKSKLMRMFKEFVRKFYQVKARRNLLNLNYLLARFMRNAGLVNQAQYIKTLKPERFAEHERIYKRVMVGARRPYDP